MSEVSTKLLQAVRMKNGDGSRAKFVGAWTIWCKETAADMVATDDFEELTALLLEMNVCREVMGVLVGATEVEEIEP